MKPNIVLNHIVVHWKTYKNLYLFFSTSDFVESVESDEKGNLSY